MGCGGYPNPAQVNDSLLRGTRSRSEQQKTNAQVSYNRRMETERLKQRETCSCN